MAVTRTAKGTASNKTSGTTLALASVASTAGRLLVVCLAYDDQTLSSVTWGTQVMNLQTAVLGAGVRTRLAWCVAEATATRTITATWAANLVAKAFVVSEFSSSLAGGVVNAGQETNNTGNGTAASTPASNPIVGGTDSVLVGVVGTEGPSGDTAGTWVTPATNGQRVGTTGNPANGNVTVSEAYTIAPTAGSTPALSKTGMTSRDWGAELQGFYWGINNNVTAADTLSAISDSAMATNVQARRAMDQPAAPEATSAFSDSFDRADQAGWGNGWTVSSTTRAVISSNVAALGVTGSASAARDVSEIGGEILLKFRFTQTPQYTARVTLAGTSATSLDGIGVALQFNASNALLVIPTAYGTDGTATTVTPSYTSSTWYWLRLRAGGVAARVQARVWVDGSAEPSTWTLDVADLQPSAAAASTAGTGTFVYLDVNLPRRVEFDDFSFSPLRVQDSVDAQKGVGGTPNSRTATDTITAVTTSVSGTVTPGTGETVIFSDTFSRTRSPGWGTSDSGHVWDDTDDPADFTVGSGVGQVAIPNTSSPHNNTVAEGTINVVDAIGRVKWLLSQRPSSGFVTMIRFYTRRGLDLGDTGDTDADDIRHAIRIRDNGSIELQHDYSINAVRTEVNATWFVTGKTYVAGDQWNCRYEVSGSAPSITVRTRVWKVGDAEPSTWDLSETFNPGSADINHGGTTGIHLQTSVGNTAVPFNLQLDDWTLSQPGGGTAVTRTASDTTSVSDSVNATKNGGGGLITYAQDTFGGTNATGWNTADIGGSWTMVGTALSEGSGVGTMSPAAGATQRGNLLSVSAQDTDSKVRVRFSDAVNTASGINAYVESRFIDSANHYRVRCQFTSTNQVRLQIEMNGTAVTNGAFTTITRETFAADTWFWIRVQTEGVNPTTIRAKVWQDGTTEPVSWDLVGTDSTAALQGAGSPGLRVFTGSTQSPAGQYDWDDLSVTSISTGGVAYTRTAADTVTSSESLARLTAFGRTTSETLTTAETVARMLAAKRFATDTTTVSESIFAAAVHSVLRTATDTVALTEQAARTLALARAPPDTVTVTESIARVKGAQRAAADTTTTSDAVSRTTAQARSALDAASRESMVPDGVVSSAQFAGATLSQGQALDNVYLTATGTSAAIRLSFPTPTSAKAAVRLDALIRAGSTDTTATVEYHENGALVLSSGSVVVPANTRQWVSVTVPAASVVDETGAEARLSLNVIGAGIDVVLWSRSGSETVAKTQGGLRTATDTTTVTEAIASVYTPGTQNLTRTATDTTTLTEQLGRTLNAARAPPETLTTSASVARVQGRARTVIDTVATTESVARTGTRLRTAADTTSVNESVAPRFGRARTAADTVATTESVAAPKVLFRTASDTTAVTDLLNQGQIRRASDTVASSDSAASLQVISRSATDATSVTDAATPLTAVRRSTSDTTAVGDGVSALSVHARTLSASAIIRTTQSRTAGLTAVIRKTQAASASVDAVIRATAAAGFGIDARLLTVQTSSLTFGAYLIRRTTGDISVEAILQSEQAGSFGATAFIQGVGVSAFATDAVVQAAQTDSASADAVIQTTATGSFGLDGYLLAIRPGLATADAVIRASIQAGLGLDAQISATTASSLSLAAVLRDVLTGSIGIDGILRKEYVGNADVSAYLLLVPEQSVAADAVLQASQTNSFGITAFIQGAGTAAFGIDAVLQSSAGSAFSLEAQIQQVSEGSISAHAVIQAAQADTYALDAYLRLIAETSFASDAVVQAEQTGTFALESLIRGEYLGVFSVESIMLAAQSRTASASAVILAANSGALAADAFLLAEQVGSIGLDATVRAQIASSFSISAFIGGVGVAGFDTDAVIKKTQTASASVDALVAIRPVVLVSVDAVLIGATTDQVALQAVIKASQVDQVSAQAIFKASQTQSAAFDAFLKLEGRDTFTSNAVIRREQTAGFGLNAIIQQSRTGGFGLDAIASSPQIGSFGTDAWIIGAAAGTFSVGAVIFGANESSFGISSWIAVPHPHFITAEIRSATLTSTEHLNGLTSELRSATLTADLRTQTLTSIERTAALIGQFMVPFEWSFGISAEIGGP